jgi:CHAT domain-containing protein/tetratricopeptide (TPR) repeat protein
MHSRSGRSRPFAEAAGLCLASLALFGAIRDDQGLLDPYAAQLTEIQWLADSTAVDSADSLARSLIAVVRARFGPASRQQYALLDTLTSLFAAGASRSIALAYGDSLMAAAPTFVEPKSAAMAQLYSRHATLRYDAGDPEGAVEDGRQAVAIARHAPGLARAQLAGYHEQLAGLCVGAWMYDSARVALEPCFDIRRETAGERSMPFAWTLGTLASLDWHSGDYTGALDAIEKAIATAEAAAPGQGSKYTRLYNLHAAILGDLQDNLRSNALFRKCVRLAMAPPTPDWRNVARYMNNVGLNETVLGRYDQARAYHDSALTIRTRIGDEGGVAESYKNLAIVAIHTGQLTDADSLLARSIRWPPSARPHPLPSDLAAILFELRVRQGRLAEADTIVAYELASRSRLLPAGAADMAAALFRQARLLRAQGDVSGAFASAMAADSIDRLCLALTARTLSERQALSYRESRPAATDLALSMAPGRLSASDRERLWDTVIRSRGQLLEEMAQRHRVLAAQSDPALGEVAAELAAARRAYANRLGRIQERTAATESALVVCRLQIEQMESRLARISMPFRHDVMRNRLGFPEVAASLPANAALVAFALYRELPAGAGVGATLEGAPVGGADSARCYAAFVLAGAHAAPMVVPLGPAARIDSLTREWRASLLASTTGTGGRAAAERATKRAGDRLREAIWDPLVPRIGPATEVMVVPDGALNLVNLAALPSSQSRYLIETGPLLHELSSERDLVRDAIEPPAGEGFLVLAAPDFDAVPGVPPSQAVVAAQAPIRPTMRGIGRDCAEFARVRFGALPSARGEGQEIVDLWRGARPSSPVSLRTGAEAGEEQFIAGAPGSGMIHVATHGVFIDPECRQGPADAGGHASLVSENPLRLCGLAMAGANHRSDPGMDHDDGILTAEEISAVDLTGVDWVVLSACDTGLGDIHAGEGVFGLRRAFAIAGAKTTIMSLWPTDDAMTRQWMKELYRARLKKGTSTAEAVRQASLEILRRLRANGASTSPSAWGAFIGAGDWR